MSSTKWYDGWGQTLNKAMRLKDILKNTRKSGNGGKELRSINRDIFFTVTHSTI